jgi:hypothetical protein
MPSKRKKRTKKRHKRHIILILFLILAVIFFFYEEFGKEDIPKSILRLFKPERKPKILPKVSIVIDDLGSSKKTAMAIFDIKAPLTLSVLPQEVYTPWIAREGYRLGYEIIGHIPMEPREPRNLGKGGLYTWMTDYEISETLDENLRSIPYIKGVSNHMGSAFTEDERAMHVLISGLKKHGLFFLDSLTTPKSVGVKLAKAQGIKVLSRDIFLDEKDNPAYIEAQWKKLIKIAKKRGYAIAQAHPRKNTIEFLKNTLKNNNEVTIVPLSKLISSKGKGF